MNKFKSTQGTESISSSSGGNIFMLIPTCKTNNPQIPKIQINIDNFVQEFKQNGRAKQSLTREQKKICSLFGLAKDQILFNTLNTENLESKEQVSNQIQDHQNLRKNRQFSIAIPQTNKCFICQESFENYYKHIGTYKHKKNQKTYLMVKQKTKMPLDQVIQSLINSLRVVDSFGSTKQRDSQNFKRRRVNQAIEYSYFQSPPQKRKYEENGGLNINSLQSTTLLNSNCLL